MSKQNNEIDKPDEPENGKFSSESAEGDGSSLVDETLSIEQMCKVAGGGQPEERTNLDWSTETLMNHPEGIDAAIAANNEIMLAKTKDVIENGSLEDIAAALEENTRQLQMLHDRMQNLFKIMG